MPRPWRYQLPFPCTAAQWLRHASRRPCHPQRPGCITGTRCVVCCCAFLVVVSPASPHSCVSHCRSCNAAGLDSPTQCLCLLRGSSHHEVAEHSRGLGLGWHPGTQPLACMLTGPLQTVWLGIHHPCTRNLLSLHDGSTVKHACMHAVPVTHLCHWCLQGARCKGSSVGSSPRDVSTVMLQVSAPCPHPSGADLITAIALLIKAGGEVNAADPKVKLLYWQHSVVHSSIAMFDTWAQTAKTAPQQHWLGQSCISACKSSRSRPLELWDVALITISS